MCELLAGFGSSDITPPIGVELAGFGWYIGRKSTGALEPLYAKTMMWQFGEVKAAIVSCDLIGVSRELTKEIRALVSGECAVPFENIIVCATHTHSGPQTIDSMIGWGEKDPGYLSALPGMALESAKSAAGRLRPARFEYGETPVSGISYNRDREGGLTDGRLKALKVVCGGEIAGFLANYSCHPVVMCEQTSLISGDFVGLAVNKACAGIASCAKAAGGAGAGSRPGPVGIFLQGSCGDQNPVYCHKPQDESVENLKSLSTIFANFIQKALGAAQPIEVNAVAVSRKEISISQTAIGKPDMLRTLKMIGDFMKHEASLPDEIVKRLKFEKAVFEALWDRPDNDNAAAQAVKRDTELQAAKFGDFVVVTHPAELFYRYQKEAETELAPYKTMVAGYANDYIGYAASPDRYDASGGDYSYAAYFVPLMIGEFPFESGIGGILANEMAALVRGMP